MRGGEIEEWVALRDRIAGLQVVKCRLAHERVLRLGLAAVPDSPGEAEPVAVRLGLCSPEVRRQRPACGHTMARYLLEEALQALRAAGELSPQVHARLAAELDAVANAIHQLDHRKGEAEKNHALVSAGRVRPPRLPEDDALALEASAAAVRALEQQHDAYAEQIGVLRDRILGYLNAVLARG